MSFSPLVRNKHFKTGPQAETDLVLKIYNQQLSKYNKGVGPKPDLQTLIDKSRVKGYGFDYNRKLPEVPPITVFKGVIKNTKILFPKDLKVTFIEECRKDSGFYLLLYSTGIKFGMSSNIARRMVEYKKPWCKNIVKSLYFYTTINIARDIENTIKRELLLRISPGEGSIEFICNTTLNKLQKLIKSLIKSNLDISDPYMLNTTL